MSILTAGLFLVTVHVLLYALKRFIVSPPLDSSFLDVAQVNAKGKKAVAVITGGCSGLGLEIAYQLYNVVGMDIILGCRNAVMASVICDHLTNSSISHQFGSSSGSSSGKRSCYAPGPLDLASFRSVRDFASQVSHIPGKVPNILILNAGIRHNRFNLTEDGVESHYQVNHLSHFLLVNLLLPIMNSSPADEVRIIHVSSSAHYYGKVDRRVYGNIGPIHKSVLSPFIEQKLEATVKRSGVGDEIYHHETHDITTTDYNDIIKRGNEIFHEIQSNRLEGVYGDTKLMQVLFSDELQKRLDSNLNQKHNRPIEDGEKNKAGMMMNRTKFKSITVHPGFVNSNMGHEDTRWMQTALVLARPFLARSLFEGSLSVLFAVTSPILHGGEYVDNCEVKQALSRSDIEIKGIDHILPPGSEPDIGRFLWDISAKLCALSITLEYDEE